MVFEKLYLGWLGVEISILYLLGRDRGSFCKFEQNIFQCISKNHSIIIVLSHRPFREEGREGDVRSGDSGFEIL